jgi:hypothetical protein
MIPVGSSSAFSARSAPTLHPRGVVDADGVMMGDGAAVLHDRPAGGPLDGLPLLQLVALALAGEEREVQRGPRLIQVRDVAHD